MRSSRVLSRIGVGAAALAVFALVGVAPASAATGETLFTTFYVDDNSTQQFARISESDASTTPLAAFVDYQKEIRSIEIYNGVGYAVANYHVTDPVSDTPTVLSWNITTGVDNPAVPVTDDGGFKGIGLTGVSTLDTVVGNPDTPDGTLITVGHYEPFDRALVDTAPSADANVVPVVDPVGTVGAGGSEDWIGTLDPVTGHFEPLILINSVDTEGAYVDSLATDPTTGVTYLMLDFADGSPLYQVADLSAETLTGLDFLTGVASDLGSGYIGAADFDSTGTLWFYYFYIQEAAGSKAAGIAAAEEAIIGTGEPLAKTTGAFSDTVDASVVGPRPDSDEGSVGGQALAVGPYTPALAKTGLPIEGILGSAGALVLAGAAVMFVTRRRLAD